MAQSPNAKTIHLDVQKTQQGRFCKTSTYTHDQHNSFFSQPTEKGMCLNGDNVSDTHFPIYATHWLLPSYTTIPGLPKLLKNKLIATKRRKRRRWNNSRTTLPCSFNSHTLKQIKSPRNNLSFFSFLFLLLSLSAFLSTSFDPAPVKQPLQND